MTGWRAVALCSLLVAGCYRIHGPLDLGPKDAAVDPADPGTPRKDGSSADGSFTDGSSSSSADGSDSALGSQGDEDDAHCVDVLRPGETLEDRAIALAAGGVHSCVATESGRVYCWGSNRAGQVGSDPPSMRAPVTQVRSIPPAVDVMAGGDHTCALSRSGGLFCWGANDRGQLGSAEVDVDPSPRALELPEPVREACLGHAHTCALSDSGIVHCWGANDQGQLGVGDRTDRFAPVRLSVSDVRQIACGQANTCALTGGGEVWCWGWYSQVPGPGPHGERLIDRHHLVPSLEPLEPAADRVLAVGAVRCVLEAGNVRCWGDAMGPLGRRELSPEVGDVQRVHAYEPTARSVELTPVTDLAVGGHACAVLQGKVLCWGGFEDHNNRLGELGVGSRRRLEVPGPKVRRVCEAAAVSLSHTHTCALSRSGIVSCWGNNRYGAASHSDDPTALVASRVWPR